MRLDGSCSTDNSGKSRFTKFLYESQDKRIASGRACRRACASWPTESYYFGDSTSG